jgi:hypothetical protein
MLQMLLKIAVAVTAFIAGWGAVAATEAVVASVNMGVQVPAVQHDDLDLDAYAVEYTLAPKYHLQIRGIGPGSTERDVLRTFGKPKKITRNSILEYRGKSYEYEGLTINLSDWSEDGFSVDRLDINSTTWEFNGLKIGSTANEVEQTLGAPAAHESSDGDLYYHGPDVLEYLDFNVMDGKVVGINAGFHGC